MGKEIFNPIKVVSRYPNKMMKQAARYWRCKHCGFILMYFSEKCLYCKNEMVECENQTGAIVK